MQTLENQLRAELYNDIPMKDPGVVRKVPIPWEEYIQVFEAVLLLKRHSSWDPAAKEHKMAYDKQLKDLQRCMTKRLFFRRYEEGDPHSYNKV